MKFVNKNTLKNITVGTISSDWTVKSMWTALNVFDDITNSSWKNITKKVLQYQEVLSGYTDYLNVSNTNVVGVTRSLSSIYSNTDLSSVTYYISLSSVGDSLVPRSFYYSKGASSYRDYDSSEITSPSNRVGVIRKDGTANNYGFVYYDKGIILLSGELATNLSTWSNISSSGALLKYSTYLDQYEHKYCCNINRKSNIVSSNLSYWTSVDQNNDTLTSSLTAYWAELGITEYSITGNVNDWLIIEEQEYPIYVTGIGLYDDYNNLVAIAKLRRPQVVFDNSNMSFIVNLRF